MAVSAVWKLAHLLDPAPHWNQGARQSTQAVPPARRVAVCPSPKIQKKAAFDMGPKFECREAEQTF